MPGWILSPLARAQLQGILDYIEEDSGSEARALKVLDDFLEALDLLADSPRIGWRRSGTESHIRWWRVHSYLVVYDATSTPLRIIQVAHGAQDLDRILEGGNRF